MKYLHKKFGKLICDKLILITIAVYYLTTREFYTLIKQNSLMKKWSALGRLTMNERTYPK